MEDDVRNFSNGCGCGCVNNGILGGLFNGCNSEILFFVIIFLLLFTNFGGGYRG